MNDLYTPEGWLNFEYIQDLPAWMIVIIGKRQVGKTYGALLNMLKYDKRFILLRRTTAELDTISATPDLNPFKVFEPDYHVGLFKHGRFCEIRHYLTDPEGVIEQGKQLGIATSLSQIAAIRGFNGSAFTDMVFDEFIPEKGVVTRKTEGDAFLNAYVTISGNRELSGKPPLRCWLLANTNNIRSSVLDALNLTDDILYARRKGKEIFTTDDGVLLIQPSSEKITELRKETALMKRVNAKGEFYKMAIENEWSYDESPFIRTLSLKGMKLLFNYDDTIFCWEGDQGFYVCRASGKGGVKYEGSKTGREQLQLQMGSLIDAYYAGLVFFADLRCQSIFQTIFNIN